MKNFLIAFKAAASKTIFATLQAEDQAAAEKFFAANFTGCKLLEIVELNI